MTAALSFLNFRIFYGRSMIAVGLDLLGVSLARLLRAGRTVKHRMTVRVCNAVRTGVTRALRIAARDVAYGRADRLAIRSGVMRGLRNHRTVVVA